MNTAPPRSLASFTDRGRLERVRLVATDVDGTLTTDGRIEPEVITAIGKLAASGIETVPVSGRSSGEVLGLVRYLPGVKRGIAENGQTLVQPDLPIRLLRGDASRQDLERAGREIAAALGTALDAAPDSVFRLGDMAFERAGRSDAEMSLIRDAAEARALHCVWSSVHVHLSHDAPDKGRALLALMPEWGVLPSDVATIGDAPNDAGLFERARFGLTVGTADVLHTLAVLPHAPELVTAAREGAAFLELAGCLLASRPA